MARHNKIVRIETMCCDDGALVVWMERVGEKLPRLYDGWGGRWVTHYTFGEEPYCISQASVERALLQEIHMPDVQ
jgi:hypothetical protein